MQTKAIFSFFSPSTDSAAKSSAQSMAPAPRELLADELVQAAGGVGPAGTWAMAVPTGQNEGPAGTW
jgi:hypothetical protein